MYGFEVVTYDVWGNAKEGYEVNDAFHCGHVEIKDLEDKTILKALKDNGYIAKHVRRNMLNIDGDDFHISIDRRRDSYPLLGLRKA